MLQPLLRAANSTARFAAKLARFVERNADQIGDLEDSLGVLLDDPTLGAAVLRFLDRAAKASAAHGGQLGPLLDDAGAALEGPLVAPALTLGKGALAAAATVPAPTARDIASRADALLDHPTLPGSAATLAAKALGIAAAHTANLESVCRSLSAAAELDPTAPRQAPDALVAAATTAAAEVAAHRRAVTRALDGATTFLRGGAFGPTLHLVSAGASAVLAQEHEVSFLLDRATSFASHSAVRAWITAAAGGADALTLDLDTPEPRVAALGGALLAKIGGVDATALSRRRAAGGTGWVETLADIASDTNGRRPMLFTVSDGAARTLREEPREDPRQLLEKVVEMTWNESSALLPALDILRILRLLLPDKVPILLGLVAKLLQQAGQDAQHIATALQSLFQAGADEIAGTLNTLGYGASVVQAALENGCGVARHDAETAVTQASQTAQTAVRTAVDKLHDLLPH